MTEAEQLFEQVYRTYGPSLYRFCLIQMKNPADAEDILQEVFCKRLYRAPVFASPDHERRWLFRVALNQCRDAWKRSNRSELPLEAAPPPSRRRSWACWTTWPPCRSPSGQSFTSTTTRATPSGRSRGSWG